MKIFEEKTFTTCTTSLFVGKPLKCEKCNIRTYEYVNKAFKRQCNYYLAILYLNYLLEINPSKMFSFEYHFS